MLCGNTSQQNFSLVPPSQSFSLTHKFIHLLALVLVFALAFGGNVPAFAASVSYVNRTTDANGKVTETNETCTNYTVVASDTMKWSDGWYVVNSEVTIGSRVTVSGTVYLILCDGATLTVNGGITLTSGQSLTIYGQTGDTGTLTVSAVEDDMAGIGGAGQGKSGGTITIKGGTVNTTGGRWAAGIGGGGRLEQVSFGGVGGTTNIYGGTVNTTGGIWAAGIGGGDYGAGGTTNIYGGMINATGTNGGAGIGSGYKGVGGTTNIYGGTVNATGSGGGAGIGSGYEGNGGTTNIYGGTVNATSNNDGPGIGDGKDASGGTTTLKFSSVYDSIYANRYTGTIKIADGKTFTDNTNLLSGDISSNLSALDGKTLKLYLYTLTLSEDISADYLKPGVGTTVTLTYTGQGATGYEPIFSVNNSVIEGKTFTMPSENVRVTATLSPITYTISYDLGGGTLPDGRNNPETYTIESDTFTLPIPTRKYYTFAGWTGTSLDAATETVTIEKGSTGSREYSATWTQHGFMPKDESTPEFAAYSMVLGGTLSVRYYVYLPDAYNSADCTIVFNVSGDTSLNPDPCTPTATTQSGDVTLYGYDCCINSAQMADEIHATLYYDNNSKTLDADTYSAEQYLNAVASDKDSYESYEVALIEAIRDYGHFVQPMLSKVNGWTIGEKYAYMHSDTTYSATSIDVVSGAVSEHKIVREPNTDIKQVLYSLTLGANTTINFYIYPADGYTGSVTVDNGTLEKLSDSQYRVRFPDIMAHELGDTKSFNITTDSGNFTVRASALCYVNTVLNLSESDETYNADTYADEVNAAVSLYKYYDATINYNNKGAE